MWASSKLKASWGKILKIQNLKLKGEYEDQDEIKRILYKIMNVFIFKYYHNETCSQTATPSKCKQSKFLARSKLGGHFLCYFLLTVRPHPVRHVGTRGGDLPRGSVAPDGKFLNWFFGKSSKIYVEVRPEVLVGGDLDVALEVPGVEPGEGQTVAK